MDIPTPLRSALEEGNVVLMLGAGASLSALDESGNRPPKAHELATLLAVKFLNDSYSSLPLNQVADYAISETDLFTVQDYIREVFLPFEPSSSHRLLPTFRWRAIVTTNYDCLIEDAYHNHPNPVQRATPILRNTDRYDRLLQDPDNLPVLKLHGCITNTHEAGCPLILSTEQYINYAIGRDRLFRLFMEFASERPVLFLGYGVQDQNIRSLLDILAREQVSRPRYYLITPAIDDISQRFWASKQITAITGTFEEALVSLDTAIGATFRGLRRTTPTGVLAISEKFAVPGAVLSDFTVKALTLDLEYVKGIETTEACDPLKFYSGVSQAWGPVALGLDVRRKLHDTILLEYFLPDALDVHEFVLIKAHAGAGKSVFLRRLAWEAAKQYGKLCLFARPDATISSSAIAQIVSLCKERIFLFVDDVLAQRSEIENLLDNLGTIRSWVTIVGGARSNEWNIASPTFQSAVTAEHTLPYLDEKELDFLVDLLERHKALKALEKLTREGRREALKERAGRQLLVALHEATSGRRFEEILHDEYSRLVPNKAKAMYLAICMLNQFGVPVRAGIISRRFGITFEEFRQQFFKPLEEVVVTIEKRGVDDYCYTARHPHIAEIVVRNELGTVDDLFNEYIACLTELNPGFSSDKKAFQRMTQARLLDGLFRTSEIVQRVFTTASEVAGTEDPFLLQQMALYEMNRDSGNLGRATSLLERAMELRPGSRILRHSLAELYLRKAESARTDLERKNLWADAERLCREMRRDATDSYPYSTLVKTGIQRLCGLVNDDEALKDEDVEGLIKSVEKDLKEGLQRFPNDPFLLAQEASLARLLSESDRLLRALHSAFVGNPRNGYVALQLAMILEQRGDVPQAQNVLKQAIDANRGNGRLHYVYGKLLLRHGIGTANDLLYHFRLAYSPGDSNHDAQLLHGRQLFVIKDFENSRKVFASLSRVRLPNVVKRRLCYPLDGNFVGVVQRMEAWYCILRCDGDGATVRLDFDDTDEALWRSLTPRSRVSFRIAFSMFGPEAFDVHVVDK